MLIATRYTPTGWTVDDNTANLIPEFRAVLADPTLGAKAMAVIALAADPTSFLSNVYEEEAVREEQAIISVYEKNLVADLYENKLVKSAKQKYHSICNTNASKLRQQYRFGIIKAGEFVESKGSKITAASFPTYVTALSKLPELIKQYDEMAKEDVAGIEDTKKIIRGGRELTYLEKKNSGKNRKKR